MKCYKVAAIDIEEKTQKTAIVYRVIQEMKSYWVWKGLVRPNLADGGSIGTLEVKIANQTFSPVSSKQGAFLRSKLLRPI